MRKNYLLMAAAALLLASCSNEADAPKNDVDNNEEDVMTLTTLAPSTQQGRIVKVNGTRADKKTRLELQYTIGQVNDAQEFNWSATSIVFGNNGAYVTWHSDAQAHNPASKWGGALDVIAFNAAGAPSFSTTYVNYDSKFNSAISGNNAFYVALTDKKKGAAVARVKYGETTAIVRQLTGSSANALSLKDGRVYAVSGYQNGGIFSIAQDFVGANEGKADVDTLVLMDGCKWIDGDLVLRTDADHAYIYNMANDVEANIGAPLLSELKYAEEWDKDGNWNVEAGDRARYYGKHTMAVDGDYIYVAGGQAEKESKNGLRVYNKNTMEQTWGNATNTTAVCVDGDFVYAATGAGLRVYKKLDGGKLELFAFESVPAVDENGNEIKDDEGNVKLVAGTTAHSCNFVAVEGEYIYMANGQSGVYVFKLDKSAPAEEETPVEE